MAEAAGLYYEIHGPAEAPPLILSSGLGGSASYWAANLAAFAARFRTIVYDQRGTGRSDRSPLASLSVDDMAADVVALLDHLGVPRAHFVGHALGGLIGLSLALSAPERLNRLVVVNGWGRLEPHTARCFDVRLALLRAAGPAEYIRAQPIFLYPANFLARQTAWLDHEEEAQLRHFPGRETVEQRIAAVRAFDIQDRLGEVSTTTLIYSAQDDVLVPSIASSRLTDRLSPASTSAFPYNVEVRWGGHACNVSDSDTFNEIVPAWLAGEPIPEN